jgi:uncharacterized DUF497 family protein
MEIEYDAWKATSNLKKHGISFSEAASVLLDSNALAIEDKHCMDEKRWIIVGISDKARLLTVVYTLRNNECIRLISARKSTRNESNYYA